MTRPLQAKSLTFAAVVFLASAAGAAGQIPSEGLCDTQFATQLVGGVQVSNCRSAILNLIANEKVGIDVAFWYMSDARYVNSLNIAFNTNKVPVRVLVDERANNSHPSNASILTSLVSTHIPMREKLPDLTYGLEILHFKMMLFTGQNVVVFSKANFTPEEYVPDTTNNTYSDEAIFFTNDNRLTNSFRRRFDDLWTDLTRYRNYANISGTPTRTYDPLLPRDSSMNFVPLQKFQDRAKARMDAEPSGGQMDIIVFRTIDHVLPDAVINAMAPPRGVTVRLITDYGRVQESGPALGCCP